MAVPVARVYLKDAHAALPPLLPTPPKWNMLHLLPTPCVAAVLPAKALAKKKPGRADADERWDAHKTKPACTGPRLSSSPRKNATSPPPRPGRADSVERWDAHKKAASAASSSSGKLMMSCTPSTNTYRWDVHMKHRLPQTELLDNGNSSSSTGSGSNDIDDTEEEEILWKPRAMYAGPSFVVAAPKPITLPMPTGLLVPVA